MVQIFTDTAANLPQKLLEEYDIRTVALRYEIDGVQAAGEFDGAAFYDAMRAGAEVKTSMVSPQTAIDAFAECLENGQEVLYMGISSGISGTVGGISMLSRELPEAADKVRVINTRGASLGEGLVVLETAMLAKEGKTLQELADYAESRCSKMQQYFVVDDLKYLHKGGRISGGARLAGTILQVKPILRGNENGEIVIHDKVRGKKKALAALADLYEMYVADKTSPIGIAHGDCPAEALHLQTLLRDKGAEGEIYSVCYEPVTGGHVGPGTVAMFFYGEAWR